MRQNLFLVLIYSIHKIYYSTKHYFNISHRLTHIIVYNNLIHLFFNSVTITVSYGRVTN